MKQLYSPVNNEEGSVILLAILILVVVSVIGIQSSNTSSLEVQIAAAQRTAKNNFYRAEGAAMHAAQAIENADTDELTARSQKWLHKSEDLDLAEISNWEYDGGSDDTAEGGSLDETYFGVMDRGIPQGSSLHMGQNSQLHIFRVFGRSIAANQGAFIEMGYKRRF